MQRLRSGPLGHKKSNSSEAPSQPRHTRKPSWQNLVSFGRKRRVSESAVPLGAERRPESLLRGHLQDQKKEDVLNDYSKLVPQELGFPHNVIGRIVLASHAPRPRSQSLSCIDRKSVAEAVQPHDHPPSQGVPKRNSPALSPPLGQRSASGTTPSHRQECPRTRSTPAVNSQVPSSEGHRVTFEDTSVKVEYSSVWVNVNYAPSLGHARSADNVDASAAARAAPYPANHAHAASDDALAKRFKALKDHRERGPPPSRSQELKALLDRRDKKSHVEPTRVSDPHKDKEIAREPLQVTRGRAARSPLPAEKYLLTKPLHHSPDATATTATPRNHSMKRSASPEAFARDGKPPPNVQWRPSQRAAGATGSRDTAAGTAHTQYRIVEQPANPTSVRSTPSVASKGANGAPNPSTAHPAVSLISGSSKNSRAAVPAAKMHHDNSAAAPRSRAGRLGRVVQATTERPLPERPLPSLPKGRSFVTSSASGAHTATVSNRDEPISVRNSPSAGQRSAVLAGESRTTSATFSQGPATQTPSGLPHADRLKKVTAPKSSGMVQTHTTTSAATSNPTGRSRRVAQTSTERPVAGQKESTASSATPSRAIPTMVPRSALRSIGSSHRTAQTTTDRCLSDHPEQRSSVASSGAHTTATAPARSSERTVAALRPSVGRGAAVSASKTRSASAASTLRPVTPNATSPLVDAVARAADWKARNPSTASATVAQRPTVPNARSPTNQRAAEMPPSPALLFPAAQIALLPNSPSSTQERGRDKTSQRGRTTVDIEYYTLSYSDPPLQTTCAAQWIVVNEPENDIKSMVGSVRSMGRSADETALSETASTITMLTDLKDLRQQVIEHAKLWSRLSQGSKDTS